MKKHDKYIVIIVEHSESEAENPQSSSGFSMKLELMFNLIIYSK